ncbi:MAG: AAA family ATPase [Anaerolineales bacterium]|nr:AAA family ATPase [Anaerolineales bacterium]
MTSRVQDPQNVEAEQAFLGSILQDPPVISRASRLVRPADFSLAWHSVIYKAMLDLDRAGTPITLISLADHLGSELAEVGGVEYLIQMEHDPRVLPLYVDAYAVLVRKYARLRRLINGCARIVRLAQRVGTNATIIDEALALAEKTLLALLKEDRLASVRPLSELVRTYLDRAKDQPASLGLSTGMALLDGLCGGLQPADLVLVAGEPGSYKTKLVLTMARNAALAERKVALFSLESSSDQVIQRLLAVETGLEAQRLRIGDIEADLPALDAAGARLAELNLYIDDTPGLLVTELRSKARWLHHLWALDLIIVNYLQLLRPDEKQADRQADLAAVSRALKALARELKLPLVAVAVLEPEADDEARLRQLGPAGYEADIIWLCERAGQNLWLKQARWRDGPAGATIELNFNDPKKET